MKLQLIGYWNDDNNNYPQYPFPKANKYFWSEIYKKFYCEKEYFVYYLEHGIICNRYRGMSQCRICGKTLGSHELHNTKYIWPDGLAHYVMMHDIELPLHFIEDIMNNKIHSVEIAEIDESKWVVNDESRSC